VISLSYVSLRSLTLFSFLQVILRLLGNADRRGGLNDTPGRDNDIGQQEEELDDDSDYGSLMGGADPPNANDPPDDIDSKEDEDLAESRSWLGMKTVTNHFVENVQDPTVQLRAQKMTRVGYLIIPPAADQSSVVVSRRANMAVSFRFSQPDEFYNATHIDNYSLFLFQFPRYSSVPNCLGRTTANVRTDEESR
jgi:hypothetical protein